MVELSVNKVPSPCSGLKSSLISANPAYEPRRFTGDELDAIRVAGRVVACYHRV
jgi:phage repressor protein C with HTH and peptisase S24 domain